MNLNVIKALLQDRFPLLVLQQPSFHRRYYAWFQQHIIPKLCIRSLLQSIFDMSGTEIGFYSITRYSRSHSAERCQEYNAQ